MLANNNQTNHSKDGWSTSMQINTRSKSIVPGGENVFDDAERMYNNNAGTQRHFCSFYAIDYNGTHGYRRATYGSGWNSMPFTGVGSTAVIPTTGGWVCWS